MTSHVRILSTGGTIASTDGKDGATPAKDGSELFDDVSALNQYAEVSIEQVAQTPSFDMDFETMAAIGRAARTAVEDGADGVVVTHGTDTMEESAYFADLTLDLEAPIVFTGAQRRPDELSPDGPANLLTAIHAAAHDRLQQYGGAYIAFDEQLHAARDVAKTHTSRLDTFRSPDSGPVASRDRNEFRFHRVPEPREQRFELIAPETNVRIISSAAGVSREPIDDALATGVDGIVLEGTGLGNATTELGNAVADAVDENIPVVVSSRCLGGSTAPVYGGGGGGETLRKHGVGFADDLSAQKARIKLALGLAAGDNPLAQFTEA